MATTAARRGHGAGTVLGALAVLLVLGSTAGCRTAPPPPPAKPDSVIIGGARMVAAAAPSSAVAENVAMAPAPGGEHDGFHGPWIEGSFQPLVRENGTYFRNETPRYGGLPRHLLRSWRNKASGEVQHELYVAYTYSASSAWVFQKAKLDDASVVALRVFDREVAKCLAKRCVRVELVAAPLPDAYLRSRADRGFQVQLLSPRGHSAVLTVPPNYVQGYLAALAGSASAP